MNESKIHSLSAALSDNSQQNNHQFKTKPAHGVQEHGPVETGFDAE